MADPNFLEDEGLTEEEIRERNRQIRAVAGAPQLRLAAGDMKVDGEPFNVPGPPNPDEVARIAGIRQDVARNQLGELTGDEDTDFVNKLRREANLEPENAALPANAQSGFTPPPVATVESLSEIADSLNRGRGVQPENQTADLTGLIEGERGPGIPGRHVAHIGAPPVIQPAVEDVTAQGLLPPVEGSFDQVPHPDAIAGLLPTRDEPGEPFFDKTRAAIATSRDEFAEAGFPSVPRPGETGTEAGARTARSAKLKAAGLGRTALGVGEDLIVDPLRGPLGFIKGFAGELFDDGPPNADAAEVEKVAVEPTGSQVVDTHGDDNTADAAEVAAQDASVLSKPGGLEQAVPPSAVSTQPGVESGVGATAADRALGPRLTPEIIARGGTEIIRGVRRTFQPEGGVGEIPFGIGVIERLQNFGLTLDGAVEATNDMEAADAALMNAGARALVAATNAVSTFTRVDPETGRETIGHMTVHQDGSVTLFDTGQLVALDDRILTVKQGETIGPNGEPIDAPDLILEQVMTDDGPVLRHLNIDDTAERAALRDRHPGLWPEFLQAAQDAGLEGQEAVEEADRLLAEAVKAADQ